MQLFKSSFSFTTKLKAKRRHFPTYLPAPACVNSPSLSTCAHTCSVVSSSFRPHGLWPAGLLCPWDSPGKNTGVGCHFLLQGIFPTGGIEPGSPTLQADSLPSESPGKPKITGVDSLSLLQRIFLTEESNQGLLQCRWILYQLSYWLGPP